MFDMLKEQFSVKKLNVADLVKSSDHSTYIVMLSGIYLRKQNVVGTSNFNRNFFLQILQIIHNTQDLGRRNLKF